MNGLPAAMAMVLPVTAEGESAQRIGIVRGDPSMWLAWYDAFRRAYHQDPVGSAHIRLPSPIGACPLVGRAMIEPALEPLIVQVSGQHRRVLLAAEAIRRLPTVPSRRIDVSASSGGIEVAFLLPDSPVKTTSKIDGFSLLEAFAASAPSEALAARFPLIAGTYPYLALRILDGLEVGPRRRAPLAAIAPAAATALLESLDDGIREAAITHLHKLSRSAEAPVNGRAR